MSVTVEVGLLSGKTATLQAGCDESVATLKCRAEAALGVGRGRLLDSSGSVLDAGLPIKRARVSYSVNGRTLNFLAIYMYFLVYFTKLELLWSGY